MIKILVTLGVLAAAIASVVFYQLFMVVPVTNDDTAARPNVNETTVAEDESGEFTGIGTLADLHARGTSLECAVSYKANEYESEVTGTYFIEGESIRGDFEVPAPEYGGAILSSIIVNNDMLYIWSEIDGQKFGIKTSADEAETTETQSPVPDDQNVSYTCKPWRVIDRSIFEPPATVLFQDPDNLFEAGMEYGTIYEEGEFVY